MKKIYPYKGIVLYETWGTWQADYVTADGNRFALHRRCTYNKHQAYVLAKAEVDYMNRRYAIGK